MPLRRPSPRLAAAITAALALAACAPAVPPSPAPAPAPTPAPTAVAAPSPAASPAAATAAADEHAGHDMSGGASSGHDMAGHTMAGHGAGLPPVAIPAGALYTEADVRFMQGMIAHHAQAVHMSRLAAERGGEPRLLRLARKIDQSQAGEIALMQQWLRANGQFAPDTASWRTMTMHGMLTAAELAALAAARGAAFDRLFLTGMIRHHEGALRMVADLHASPRAAQDVDVSVLANDVETTQTAEIALMRQMLDAL